MINDWENDAKSPKICDLAKDFTIFVLDNRLVNGTINF